jgi:tRNA uridine 5-carboxymethylaminomethyl modification enzyme
MSLVEGRFANAELPCASAAEWGLASAQGDAVFVSTVIEQVEINAKYSGYIDRQKAEVERAAYFEHLRLPVELDYMQVSALSIEARQRLSKFRPETLGLASRLSGITPATISLLLIHLKRGNFRGFVEQAGLSVESQADRVTVVPTT